MKGNAVIGQSGGPTSVINASLCGILSAACKCPEIQNLFGMRYGIEGFMAEHLVDLGAESPEAVQGLKTTPSSALGSCRHKLREEDLPKILEVLKKFKIHYIFLIGGNDTMDTIHRIEEYAQANRYELIGIGVPKTVDNDLYGTDHTPGFASAARYIALSVMQAGILAQDMQKVDQFVVFQCIGRHAGWLVGAAAAGKKNSEEAPHILCFPERPFEKDRFLAKVKKCHECYGFVSVVCGEGIAYIDGTPVSASQTKDKFNNTEFGAMGGTSAAIVLHRIISDEFGFRGEFQIPESLPMCAADRAVQLDMEEAEMCGRKAVELAVGGISGVMVTLERKPGIEYACTTGTVSLKEVAVRAKPLPDKYIDKEGYFITDQFLDYMKPLIGPLPEYTKLNYVKQILKSSHREDYARR